MTRSSTASRHLFRPVRVGTLVLAVALTALVAGPDAEAAGPALTVLAAGDLRGEIEPCGCSPEGQMGGLPRRLSYLAEQAASSGSEPTRAPLLVDLGNNFPEPTEQGRHKIALIRDLMRVFPPDAVLPGPGELALSVKELDDALPYVISNDLTGGVFQRVRRVDRELGGQRISIGIYGYLSPDAVYQGPQSGLHLEPAGPALRGSLQRLRASTREHRSILLFRGSDAELTYFVAAGEFDLIIAGNPSADEMNQVTARKVADTVVPQVPTKGQGLLRLPLPAPGEGLEPPVDWLTDAWADHPDAKPVFATYNDRVQALFFARLETMERRQKASPFVGAAACAACHPAQQGVWEQSRHSHALATLQRVGKQHDPECLACHVVGLERDGYLSEDLTPQFANVQCENCHGAARAHTANPTLKPGPPPSVNAAAPERPGEETCRTCHRGSHSPTFSYTEYWPKIAHGANAQQQASTGSGRARAAP